MRGLGYVLALWLLVAGQAGALTLALGGDINLARGAFQANARPFGALGPALRADITAANLESPLTDAPRHTAGIDLRATPEAVAALRPFTHLSTENNHALDGGAAGQQQERRVLRASHLQPLSRSATFTEVRGVRVAFLAYLDDGQAAPPLAEVRQAARRAQLVVVFPHWGAEYNPVTDRQRGQARQLVAAGAGLVVGSGPHVLQGHERLGKALVLYSLGNLLFDQPYPATWPSAVVRVTASAGKLAACAVPTGGSATTGEAASRAGPPHSGESARYRRFSSGCPHDFVDILWFSGDARRPSRVG